MIHHSTLDAVKDLERSGQLLRVVDEVDPYLDMAEIQRRLYPLKAPAVLFERVKGSRFPALANLYGTKARTQFLFRHTIDVVEALIEAKGDLQSLFRHPKLWAKLPFAGLTALPRRVRAGPVLLGEARMGDLPQIQSWPDDGGPFITLPQVCTLDPARSSILGSNLGMYRIQIAGNEFRKDEECGLHYQIHRGIGVHHQRAMELGIPLKVSIFVGGPPAHAFAAVMPLPEGMSELSFAGLLAGTPFRYVLRDGWVISTEADFCILGEVAPDLKPEGPFGDHLGYYSLKHEFPYLKIRAVYHRPNAIWPFTVVGRPPQEDTTFGEMIHGLTGKAVPTTIPGVQQIHAVDAAGVHPLLLAIGSERYVPFVEREPRELLTQANALLGFGQVSLTKYLWIACVQDNPKLDAHDIPHFISHVLERMDLGRDLHFQTHSTMDTLDYSGVSMNRGSKLVIAAAGPKRRDLGSDASGLFRLSLPSDFFNPKMVIPGVVAVRGPKWGNALQANIDADRLCAMLAQWEDREQWPLVTIVDDSEFASRNLENWLWVTFTKSNPSHDVFGAGSSVEHKHWKCSAPLVIDARQKAHHAPPLIEDPSVTRRVDALFAKNGIFGGLRSHE
jgi:4-hydroxy-3-polyprenylbenzoate decarboxylase